MGLQVKQGETKTFEFSNVSISGISLDSFIQHTTANTAFVAGDGFDYNNIDVNIQLHRNGRKHEIFHDNVLPALLASNFHKSTFQYLYNKSGNPVGTVTLAAASGVDETAIVPAKLDFGGVVNLKGSDKITVEVRVGDSVLTNADSSTSYITIDYIPGVGLEWETPVIKVVTVDDSQKKQTHSFGMNVTELTFINLDKTSNLVADQVIDNIDLDSDRLSLDLTDKELHAIRDTEFQAKGVGQERCQCFSLLRGEVDECQIVVDYDTANLNGSKNFWVARSFVHDPIAIKRSEKSYAKHSRYARRKAGM